VNLFNFLNSFLYDIHPLEIPVAVLLPYFLVLTIGFLGFGSAFFLTLRRLRQERRCILRVLKILQASHQEWFYCHLKVKRGIGSEGLSSYLGWDESFETLEDFTKALQRKFSFNLTPFINFPEQKAENFKIHIQHPDTGQSCEFSAMWEGTLQEQDDLVFWLRDTTDFSREIKVHHHKLTSVIEENTRLKEMLDLLPLPVWFRNSQGWLTYCNRFYAEALDSSNEYITQENTLLWIDARWDEDVGNTKNLQNLIEPLKRHILVQGERRFFEFREESLDSLEGVMGYGLDLTNLEKALSDLEQHSMAYREVLENLSAGVTIYGADKRLKFFNHAYARLFETDEKWLNTGPTLGEVLDDVRHRRLLSEQADYQSFRKQQLQMVSSLISPFQQLEHLPDERTIRRISAPHPMGGVFFIFEDVTNSLSLERQYNTQLAVHWASLDNLYEGVAVFGSDNQLKLINPAFIYIWKMDREKIKIGQHISEAVNMLKETFIFEGEWDNYRSRLISRVTDRIPKESKLNCKDGRVINFNYVPLPDGSHLLTCMDITDSYRIEKILDERSHLDRASIA
jgi:PAS domain-containing protein